MVLSAAFILANAFAESMPALQTREITKNHPVAAGIALIGQMLAKTAAERPSMADVARRLEAMLHARDSSKPEEIELPLPSLPGPPQRPGALEEKQPAAPAPQPSQLLKWVVLAGAVSFFLGSVFLLVLLLLLRH